MFCRFDRVLREQPAVFNARPEDIRLRERYHQQRRRVSEGPPVGLVAKPKKLLNPQGASCLLLFQSQRLSGRREVRPHLTKSWICCWCLWERIQDFLTVSDTAQCWVPSSADTRQSTVTQTQTHLKVTFANFHSRHHVLHVVTMTTAGTTLATVVSRRRWPASTTSRQGSLLTAALSCMAESRRMEMTSASPTQA